MAAEKNNGRSHERDLESIPPDIQGRHSDSGQRFLLSRAHHKGSSAAML